jgi:hypothetical protein
MDQQIQLRVFDSLEDLLKIGPAVTECDQIVLRSMAQGGSFRRQGPDDP